MATPAGRTEEEIATQLKEWLTADPKRFEVLAKHYYDLFAYHAAQRLTTFNFFIVSLSFFSNAYATLATKGDDAHGFYYVMASVLSVLAWMLVVTFSRLDKRNEQIILINERPLKQIQAFLAAEVGAPSWKTFENSNDEARPLRTFGTLLPIIYVVAGLLTALGGAYGLVLANLIGLCSAALITALLWSGSIAAVLVEGSPRSARRSAAKAAAPAA
jgi:hypothetical protein